MSDRRRSGKKKSYQSSLFVRNLAKSAKADDVRELCSKYAEVKDVYFPPNHHTKEHKGFGFVEFHNEDDAKTVLDKIKGVEIHGNVIDVMVAREGRKTPGEMKDKSRGGRRGGRSRSRSGSRNRDRRHRRRSYSSDSSDSHSRRRRRDKDSRRKRRSSRSRSSRSRSRSNGRDKERSRKDKKRNDRKQSASPRKGDKNGKHSKDNAKSASKSKSRSKSRSESGSRSGSRD